MGEGLTAPKETHLGLEEVDEGRGDVDPVENADHRGSKVLDLRICRDWRRTFRDVLYPDRLDDTRAALDKTHHTGTGRCAYILDVAPVVFYQVCRRNHDT